MKIKYLFNFVLESHGRSRSRRQKRDKSGRLAALEKFKELKAAGKRRLSDVNIAHFIFNSAVLLKVCCLINSIIVSMKIVILTTFTTMWMKRRIQT